jgi:protein TonB
MSETRKHQDSLGDKSLRTHPHTETADPLQDSLDELVRLSDSLVDNLALEEPEESPALTEEPTLHVDVSTELSETPEPEPAAEAATTEQEEAEPSGWSIQIDEHPPEVNQQSRREALRETLDALSELIDDPSPPLKSAAIQVEGDHGEDITACLDKVMATDDVAIEAEPAPSEVFEEKTTREKVAEMPGKDAPPVAPADPSEETGVETAVAGGADLAVDETDAGVADVEVETADAVVANVAVETSSSTATETPERSTGIWWLLAIVVVIAALATTYWVMNSPSATPTVTTTAEAPVPDPPVVYTKRSQINGPTKTTAAAEPILAEPTPTPALAAARAPEPAAVVVSKPAAVEIEATPEPVTQPVEPAAPPLPFAMAASRGKTTETGGSQPQTAGVVGISLAQIIKSTEPTAAEPVIATARKAQLRTIEVALPTDTEPVVIDRIEPVFDRRSLRKGEFQRVVLRVLVDQRGRVVRVVVDESESGSEAEFAAINAVLRWTYEPALESGEPVRSWTSESFEFTRQN